MTTQHKTNTCLACKQVYLITDADEAQTFNREAWEEHLEVCPANAETLTLDEVNEILAA